MPPFIIKISKVISNFFNPLVSLIIFFIYSSSRGTDGLSASQNFIPAVVIILLPVLIWILWNVKKGHYTNMDVSDRKQRRTLYYFIGVMILAYLCFQYFYHSFTDITALFLLVLLVIMGISNFFIKSSMHTAFNLFISALFFSQDIEVGLIWLFISVLVGITRVILKRHTVKEVLMGVFLGLSVSFAYLYTQIQSVPHL